MHPAKTRISLRFHPVWWVFTVCSMGTKDPRCLHMTGEGTDQTGWMPRLISRQLIWVFAGCRLKYHFVDSVVLQLICKDDTKMTTSRAGKQVNWPDWTICIQESLTVIKALHTPPLCLFLLLRMFWHKKLSIIPDLIKSTNCLTRYWA